MPAPYPEPDFTTILDLFSYSNEILGGLFGVYTLISVFLIAYISIVSNHKSDTAFATASFITAVSSYFLMVMGLVGTQIPVITTIMMVVSVFALKKE